jgi:hypothetical protein
MHLTVHRCEIVKFCLCKVCFMSQRYCLCDICHNYLTKKCSNRMRRMKCKVKRFLLK